MDKWKTLSAAITNPRHYKVLAALFTSFGIVFAYFAVVAEALYLPLFIVAGGLMAVSIAMIQARILEIRIAAVGYLFSEVLGDPDMGDDSLADKYDRTIFDDALYHSGWSKWSALWRLVAVLGLVGLNASTVTWLFIFAGICLLSELYIEKAFLVAVTKGMNDVRAQVSRSRVVA